MIRKDEIMEKKCGKCPYFGIVGNEETVNIWGCTRFRCISVLVDDYLGGDKEKIANFYGFETYQDMCEVMYKAHF